MGDSNSRPDGPKPPALPTALIPVVLINFPLLCGQAFLTRLTSPANRERPCPSDFTVLIRFGCKRFSERPRPAARSQAARATLKYTEAPTEVTLTNKYIITSSTQIDVYSVNNMFCKPDTRQPRQQSNSRQVFKMDPIILICVIYCFLRLGKPTRPWLAGALIMSRPP